jgi:hypothetical protein
MLNAKEAIIEKLRELALNSKIGLDYDWISKELAFLDMEITEDQLKAFVNGEYAYESNYDYHNPLSDAWDIFDDICSNGM